MSAPFRFAPRRQVSTESGGTTFVAAGSALQALDMHGIPSADYRTAVVTQGGTSTSGTVFTYYERWIA